jgi:hypothetical protein
MACFLSVIIGIISDLIRTNRVLIEDTLEHTKKMRFGHGEFLSASEQLDELMLPPSGSLLRSGQVAEARDA